MGEEDRDQRVAFRFNTSNLTICSLNAWKLYLGAIQNSKPMIPHELYTRPAEGLIDNKMDKIKMRQRVSDSLAKDDKDLKSGSGIGMHLTSTVRKSKTLDEKDTFAFYQSRCNISKETKKSKFIRSTCKTYLEKKIFLCHHQTDRDCFNQHVYTCHDLSYKGSYH